MTVPDAADAAEIRRRASAWMAIDPDPATRDQLAGVVARADRTGDDGELRALFDGRLRFGTAGLRGPLGPGPNRMNVLVASQTAAALARVLVAGDDVAGVGGDATRPCVVVGRDARHGSAAMAAAIVDVVASHGIDVAAFSGPVPTPLVASTALATGAAAAVVVTASHNPAADNGIKVYWSDGAQIVPPVDGRIAAAIDDVAAEMVAAPAAPAAAPAAIATVLRPAGPTGQVRDLGPSVGTPTADEYVGRVLAARPAARPAGRSDGRSDGRRSPTTVPIASSSLHGVGGALLEQVLRAAGHDDLHVVAEQRDPDPDFPTVAVPNPEEPGTLDLLLVEAARAGCAVALANDPDADRLAVAVPSTDGWRQLTGDEVGAALTAHLLDRAVAAGVTDPLVTSTVVSSQLPMRIAEAAGSHHEETLTGFKWLCRPAIRHPTWTQVLAYEEALGYAIGPGVRDKDGIGAALAVADLVVCLAADGRDLLDVLDELSVRHGAHVTRNGWTTLDGPGATDRLAALVESLAADPVDELGGRPVVRRDRPAPDVLRMWTDDGTRVVLRPSGTEPKLKHYCEAVVAVDGSDDASLARARATAADRLDAVTADLARLTHAAGP